MRPNHLVDIAAALREVFARRRFLILAIAITVGVFLFSVYLPNIGLIRDVVLASDYSFTAKMRLFVALAGSFRTNFTAFNATAVVTTSILIGTNIAMLAHLIAQRRSALRESAAATGVLGALAGILGIGCAACGSVILTSILASLGASGLLLALPLRGGEFGFVGVALLLVSIALLGKRIRAPLVC